MMVKNFDDGYDEKKINKKISKKLFNIKWKINSLKDSSLKITEEDRYY